PGGSAGKTEDVAHAQRGDGVCPVHADLHGLAAGTGQGGDFRAHGPDRRYRRHRAGASHDVHAGADRLVDQSGADPGGLFLLAARLGRDDGEGAQPVAASSREEDRCTGRRVSRSARRVHSRAVAGDGGAGCDLCGSDLRDSGRRRAVRLHRHLAGPASGGGDHGA
nr:hypothetical protein [Tanacetum cinerariifolium]